ncbi:OLC1v1001262C1 [Oldenlandia corymbosa var. corymbosa]|uniref:OLC1v1001262C1 n=1 Tax=Oldenlandia corymbosa var. corymbosa TaxID=529605 RepID=A0AAV1D4X8_OLDCO|nr:OLC1v1001262C1 [Oldenlandia corymbosa var. corymbosa]
MASEQNSNQHVVQPSFVHEGRNETVGNVVNSFSLPANHVETSGPSSPKTAKITNHAASSAPISPSPNQAVVASVPVSSVQTNAASVPITAAQRYIADINGLIDTKSIHFFIVARIMMLWKVPESSKSSKIKSMEMTLIDAQGGKIQATVPGRYVKDFQDILKEGSVRRLSRFDHGLNIAGGFRCAKHEYKIVFESNTLIEDLRGHIIAYSDPIVDYDKKRISVELEDERRTTEADIIKNYVDDVAEDQDIDHKMSAVYNQSRTTNQDSTAKVVDKQFFSGIHWPSEQNIANAVDVKQYNWEFMIYREENEAAGFEGPKWEEFVDYYFNHLKCINVIFVYIGNLKFNLRIFDNKGYCCNLMLEDSDTSDGEIDLVAYLSSNGDQNTFSAIMNNIQILRGRLV